jgi:hypothetical protein
LLLWHVNNRQSKLKKVPPYRFTGNASSLAGLLLRFTGGMQAIARKGLTGRWARCNSAPMYFSIFLSHLYRNFALSRGWQNLGLNKLLPRLVPAVLVLGTVYLLVTVVKIYCIRLWLQPSL